MRPKIVAVGEVLWDLLPSGPQLGGAPANFSVLLSAFGGESILISRVGKDDWGTKARAQLGERGLDLRHLTVDPSAPTGTVSVDLDPQGQPRFTIHESVAWDQLTADPEALTLAASADAICFGTLAQRTPHARRAIQSLVAAVPPERLRLCDINLRAPFYDADVIEASLQGANALKLNETELPILGGLFGLPEEAAGAVEALAERFGLRLVVLTLGAAGSQVWDQGTWTHAEGQRVSVRDTVGAGDAFTAALVMGYWLGWPMPRVVATATQIAAYVCTQPGAMPRLPLELTEPFRAATAG